MRRNRTLRELSLLKTNESDLLEKANRDTWNPVAMNQGRGHCHRKGAEGDNFVFQEKTMLKRAMCALVTFLN